jgi:hypothetical protein
VADDRPGAPAGHFWWSGDRDQVGQFLHGYRSAWLPASLLAPEWQDALADALCAGSRHWHISLHFNKGLAGAPADVLAAAKDTAMHPVVLERIFPPNLKCEKPVKELNLLHKSF